MNNRYLTIVILLLVCLSTVKAQKLKTAGYKPKEVEVGVVEHLGDTIPLDLWFYNEDSEQVTLRSMLRQAYDNELCLF